MNILFIIIGCVIILVFILIHSEKKARKSFSEFAEKRGWKFYNKDIIGLNEQMKHSIFFGWGNSVSKPYNIIDLNGGKLFQITVGRRISYTFTMYIDYLEVPDIIIFKKTFFSDLSIALTSNYYRNYKQININGFTDKYVVLGIDEKAVVDWIKKTGHILYEKLENYAFGIDKNILVVYNFKYKLRLNSVEKYIKECKSFKNIA